MNPVRSCDYTGFFARMARVSQSLPYAPATLFPAASASAPGPLPFLGAGAAFGFSCKLSRRIKLAPGSLVSGQPLASALVAATANGLLLHMAAA
jgi:hypothetical protein